jgi:hypothetical protein
MKKSILIGSFIATLALLLLPSANAIPNTTGLKNVNTLPNLKDVKQIDSDELLFLLYELTQEYPWVPVEIIQQLEAIEDEDVFEDETTQQSSDNNQTFLERIWQRVFNYRLFRLYLSLVLFLYFRSKLTLLRTSTWSIKVLRWIKIGTIFGFIDPIPEEPPETPEIIFVQDFVNNTLTVVSINQEDVLWLDIDEIGSGACDPLPEGTVAPGDEITNCTGIIVLRYIPTNGVLGIFEF